MKRILFFLLILAIADLLINIVSAQSIGINNDGSAPNANAMLDIKSFNKGLLIPRTSTAGRTAIPTIKGLLVYDTTTNSFWYNDGSPWKNLSAGSSGWYLTGNSGTDTSTNFIGTTDGQPLLIKVNNNLSGTLQYNFPFNTIFLGNSSITDVISTGGFHAPSDERLKFNVHENVPGLLFINKLKPVKNSEKFSFFLGDAYKENTETFAHSLRFIIPGKTYMVTLQPSDDNGTVELFFRKQTG
ncbi:MAG: hypothetical protein ABI402_17950 [Ferruginibacter sp.]